MGKGRPIGSRNKTQLFLEQLGSEQAEAILRKTIEQALSGDFQAQKLILDRVYPIPKARHYITHPKIQNIKTKKQLEEAMEETLNQVGCGELSLEEAQGATALIEKRGILMLQHENEILERLIEQAKNNESRF